MFSTDTSSEASGQRCLRRSPSEEKENGALTFGWDRRPAEDRQHVLLIGPGMHLSAALPPSFICSSALGSPQLPLNSPDTLPCRSQLLRFHQLPGQPLLLLRASEVRSPHVRVCVFPPLSAAPRMRARWLWVVYRQQTPSSPAIIANVRWHC